MNAAPLHRAEALAATLPPLLAAAERIAATVLAGVHGRRRVGPGDAFWQFRPAQPGDGAADIDWRQSARAERLYVRQSEWAAAQTICLWRDPSTRMDWRSQPDSQSKAERADLLLLAVASLLLRAGERVRLIAPGLPIFSGRPGLARLAAQLGTLSEQPDPALLPRHAQVVLLGDFLAPMHELEPLLAALAARPVRAHLLQVLDPAEETLPYAGRVLFTPVGEGGAAELVANVDELRPAYVARLTAHRQALADFCAKVGFGLQTHRSDAPPATALMALAMALLPAQAVRR